jgi:hypothetical protein
VDQLVAPGGGHDRPEVGDDGGALPFERDPAEAGDQLEAGRVPEGLLALIGSIDGPADLGEHHDDNIRERGETRGQRLARGMRGRATTTMSTDELMELLRSE